MAWPDGSRANGEPASGRPARERRKTGMRIRGSVARRAMFGASLVLLSAAAWCTATAYRASALGETRTLSMYNIHTKETLTVTFKRDGKYDEAALKQLNTFMRDWRANKETKMDPALIDLIWTLHKQLGSNEPVHLICGLSHRRDQRIDAQEGRRPSQEEPAYPRQGRRYQLPRRPGEDAAQLRAGAGIGGVGYYPTSGIPFVHVDTGHVRMWPRIPRLELAALFPDGKTKYLPTDGKPITVDDYKLALAKGMVNKTMVASLRPRQVAGRRRQDVVRRGGARRADRDRCAAADPRLLHAAGDRRGPARARHAAGQAVHLCQRRRHVAAELRPQGAPSPSRLRRCPPMKTPRSWARPRPTTTIPTS